ncbi:MAG: hypothetical protein AAB036_08940 [Elusimicrobiota bacterium]
MKRVRNAVVIIILCIIGAVSVKKKAPELALNVPAPDQIKDAVAGNRIRPRHPLNVSRGQSDDIRDSIAGNPVGTPQGTPNSTNSLDDIGEPPRGSGNGGFSPLANNNPPYNPPPLSPSGPEEENSDTCGGYGPLALQSSCN